MRMFFYLGLALLGLGFIAAAAENASHAIPGVAPTFILPAYDLWYAFWPKSLLVFEIRVERLFGEWAWDPLLLSILKMPAWLIFGGPGLVLLVLFRPSRGHGSSEEIAEAQEQFEFYNQLSKQALDELPPGEEHGPRDIMPEHPIEDDGTDATRPDDFVPGADPFAAGRDREP